MSKLQKAQSLSVAETEQKLPVVQAIQQSQQQALQVLQQAQVAAVNQQAELAKSAQEMAQNLNLLAVETTKSAQELKEVITDPQKGAIRAVNALNKTTKSAQKVMDDLPEQVSQALQQTSSKILLIVWVFGLMTGIVLLLGLLMWQPHLIQALWGMSEAVH